MNLERRPLKPALGVLSVALALPIQSRAAEAGPAVFELRGHVGRILVMNPAASDRYYRGSRFEASSVILAWEAHGVRLFAPWRDPHSPDDPEAAVGPAEEFGFPEPEGFATVAPGGRFLKIGVGWLERPDDEPYFFNRAYRIVDGGIWTAHAERDRVTFEHRLGTAGERRAYRYVKTVRLADEGATIEISRRLENVGKDPIRTNHYAHNFVLFDDRPAHGGYTLTFPVPMEAEGATRAELGRIDGRVLTLGPEPFAGRAYYARLAPAVASDEMPERVTIRHPKSAVELEIVNDLPVRRVVVFALDNVVSPEFFRDLALAPGEEVEWGGRYRARLR